MKPLDLVREKLAVILWPSRFSRKDMHRRAVHDLLQHRRITQMPPPMILMPKTLQMNASMILTSKTLADE
jgi:hypothetical protein